MKGSFDQVLLPRRGLIGPGAGLLALCGGAHAQCVPTWSGLDGGADWRVRAIAFWRGPGPGVGHVFIAGAFDSLGGVNARRVGAWDGWRAFPLKQGIGTATTGEVWGINGLSGPLGPAPGPGLYAGGYFSTAGGAPANSIARWDGLSWSTFGGGVNGYAWEFTVYDEGGKGSGAPALFVGGLMVDVGGLGAPGVVRWDGVSWSTLGSGLQGFNGQEPNVTEMLVWDDDGPGPRRPGLYAGGNFQNAGGATAWNIARWDGAAWEPMRVGTTALVRALEAFDEDGPGSSAEALYVGGAFSTVGGPVGGPGSLYVSGLARWDGQDWSVVDGWQASATVYDLLTWDDDGPGPRKPSLFIAGFINNAPGVPVANHIVRWDGDQFYPLENGLTNFGAGTHVASMAVFDEDGDGPNPGGLYVGGLFHNAGTVETHHVARWGCPLPPRCDANCNKDFHPVTGQHVLSVADFGCFQTRYILQDLSADCNEDGVLSVADFGCFQTRFVTGCP